MASQAFKRHLDAVNSGTVDKSNVIGIRKAFNAFERSSAGYSGSSTAPMIDLGEFEAMNEALADKRPLVTGELVETGKALLTSKRYARKLASVQDIIADLQGFRLVGFHAFDDRGEHYVPVYRAFDSKGQSFPFYTVSWQSGGDGPEIASANYF